MNSRIADGDKRPFSNNDFTRPLKKNNLKLYIMLVWDKEFADGKIYLVDTASIIHYKYTHINFKYKLYSFGVLCHGYRQQKKHYFSSNTFYHKEW